MDPSETYASQANKPAVHAAASEAIIHTLRRIFLAAYVIVIHPITLSDQPRCCVGPTIPVFPSPAGGTGRARASGMVLGQAERQFNHQAPAGSVRNVALGSLTNARRPTAWIAAS